MFTAAPVDKPIISRETTPSRRLVYQGCSLISLYNTFNIRETISVKTWVIRWPGRLLIWWWIVPQTPPSVVRSYNWKLLPMIPMTCRCVRQCFETQPKGCRVMTLFSKFLYIHIFLYPVTRWVNGYTHQNQCSNSFYLPAEKKWN